MIHFQQESFNFIFNPPLKEDDFISSTSNFQAKTLVEAWPNWPAHAAIIYGPPRCGKTRLALMWSRISKALFVTEKEIYDPYFISRTATHTYFILEDIERIYDEVALLHFFNAVKEHNRYLLMTLTTNPANAKIRLPDLKSRLISVPSAGIDNPDEELLKIMFVKKFTERQLKVNMEVIDYLISHMERSFTALYHIVATLDKKALTEKRNITIPFVKATLSL